MTPKEVTHIVNTNFAALERACMEAHTRDTSGRALRLLDRLVAVATRQEREHRRGVGGRYKVSIATTARYFAVRCVASDRVLRTGATPERVLRELYEVREDHLWGALLGQLLRDAQNGSSFAASPAFSEIDYARDIA